MSKESDDTGPDRLEPVVLVRGRRRPGRRGLLTLVHFSAQLEPCLTQKNTLYTLNTP